ncbi:unnamed protein product [Rhizoctonia solani]|uniref:Uncharacterized protein n=1 Tax=Rhizoctonia solani TaxID=456999 RepID=A0A8H3E374_9AGAM|nr:unnamed protein product [Rhizoctonia solani]
MQWLYKLPDVNVGIVILPPVPLALFMILPPSFCVSSPLWRSSGAHGSRTKHPCDSTPSTYHYTTFNQQASYGASTQLLRRLVWESTIPLEIRIDRKELPQEVTLTWKAIMLLGFPTTLRSPSRHTLTGYPPRPSIISSPHLDNGTETSRRTLKIDFTSS